MEIKTINPANGEIIRIYNELTFSEIDGIIHKAHSTYLDWRKTSFATRSGLMNKAADILIAGKNEYGELMALEMGKPLAQGIGEAEKCAWVCRYYAENAENFLKSVLVPTSASKSYVTFQPIGVVFAIMPWNFPFWQVFRFAVPALMAGNAGVLKHSGNTMGCAIAIEDVFRKAGFPEGLFANLVISGGRAETVIQHPLVQAVTLTGSTPVGKKVAAIAGGLIKKTVLELGGSDPYIILPDADLDKAADTCVNARLVNSGQSCIAAKRFIVVKSVLNQFEVLMVNKMKKKTMGNPMEPGIDVGPQARKDLQQELALQVEHSIEKGAKLLLGGVIPESDGYFYPPTILTNVKKGMPAYDEELFGPVAAIIPAEDDSDAVRIANDSEFGLGAAIFSSNIERAEKIAREDILAGSCFVNDFVRSDPRLPFGGIKQSGYGRELSLFGIREFVNIKTIYIA